jgi:hypothetical protein
MPISVWFEKVFLSSEFCPDRFLIGRFSGDHHWPVLGDQRSTKITREITQIWCAPRVLRPNRLDVNASFGVT